MDNKDSLENVESKWVGEIAEHCPGVKIVLVALKCDLREEQEKDDDADGAAAPRSIIQYQEGLEVARRIGALRYLGRPSSLTPEQAQSQSADNVGGRVLSYAKSRRQRSFHRSRSSCPDSQTQEPKEQQQQQVPHHVKRRIPAFSLG